MLQTAISVPRTKLAAFCRRHHVRRLALFGSALRDDFGPESDVDFLVTFDPAVRLTLFDVIHAEEELSAIVGRSVDLVEREPIEQSRNWIRRRSILGGAQPIYVS